MSQAEHPLPAPPATGGNGGGPSLAAFEDAWQRGQRPVLEDFLPPEMAQRAAMLLDLVRLDLGYRLKAGEQARLEEYLERHPDLRQDRDGVLVLIQAEQNWRKQLGGGSLWSEYLRRFPEYRNQLAAIASDVPTNPSDESLPNQPAGPDAQPARLGRYVISARLGSGGFGVVYKGYDDELRREVAIKVPHRQRIARPEDAEAYLAEARILAGLDHLHIVPVYDVGRTDDGLCFVVSKFIQGSDLAGRISLGRLPYAVAAELIRQVADALHYAHHQGLVHRDIKPGNILLESDTKAYVADFGLALKEDDYGKGHGFCGTPAYMSPEQASGEGHRVDGRSDIFSLGVVFYELLTGRRPFRGDSADVLLMEIVTHEPRPPRQLDDQVPRELERICLKALSKKASERYTTARDMAEDLGHWTVVRGSSSVAEEAKLPSTMPHDSPVPKPPFTSNYELRATDSDTPVPVKIVPKGLRSFDAHDADFFLELLPGPRDRDGLPDSIRFWKTRIEEMDADNTFAVGLIYGPSGCGKSSLVKAGLLPRLSDKVIAVYVEAGANETEARLLNGLRKRCPALSEGLGLKETLTALRRGQAFPPGKKVLIVLDQFEQWLHANKEAKNPELVQALRQCDGGRVQCIVMVRDDFWLAVSRFLKEVEIRLVEGQNSALVDLFDVDHACKVLAAFGRAFGKLPESSGQTTSEQKAFLDQAAAGLAQEGKVVCVRLALFAEMLKGKPWTAATLKEAGGTEGVGVRFLEETFSAQTAPPEHRYHQKAARAVLKALLPESGSDIKGHMRSYTELLNTSAYSVRPQDFDDLIRILDSELRLITPTDPEGTDDSRNDKRPRLSLATAGEQTTSEAACGYEGKYYQLTHDYLVPSLRDWLTRKQKETRHGRAELRLAERAALWNQKPANRHLPAWWEWANIRLWTRQQDWSGGQRKLMKKAGRYHVTRGLFLAAAVALVGWIGYEAHGRLQARALLDSLFRADTAKVPAIVADMGPYRVWLDPLLHEALDDPPKRLHASLALLPVDPAQADFVYERLLTAAPPELPAMRELLLKYGGDILPKLRAVVRDDKDAKRRLRAACALAGAEQGDTSCWPPAAGAVTDELLTALQDNPSHYAPLVELLRPARLQLLDALGKVCRNRGRPEAQRSFATTIIADYAADQPERLANLLMDGDDKQFPVLLAKLKLRAADGLGFLGQELTKNIPRSEEPKNDKVNTSADVFRKSDVISLKDARVKVVVGGKALQLPARRFAVKLQAGKKYAISMTSAEVDAFLVLQDQQGVELGSDDDSGGGTNSLLMYKAARDDTYQVFAAALPPEGGSVKAAGAFTLAVVDADVFAAAAKRRAAAAKQRFELARRQEEDREVLAKRQANAAVALLNMNQAEKVWPLLKHSPDPRVRSYLIHRLAPLGADPEAIVKRLDEEPDVTSRRALLLILGSFSPEPAASGDGAAAVAVGSRVKERPALLKKVQELYRTDPDAGLHAAAEWLLRTWKQDDWLRKVNAGWAGDQEEQQKRLGGIKEQFLAPRPSSLASRWYVNGQGQTMIVIRGDEFLMGSPVAEEGREGGPEGNLETLHRKRIPRTFAIAAHEVTVEQFLRLRPDHVYGKQYAREKDAPINQVTWYDAARYCNLLSKKENIPEKEWCYEPNEKGFYAQGMKIQPNYLRLTGYRLPTEAEWEYACRAGALTSRYYGQSEALLGRYAWYTKNSLDRWMLPVGTLKPNDFGLFDMQGNALEWCQEKAFYYKATEVDDREFPGAPSPPLEKVVADKNVRVLRGGSFNFQPRLVRSAYRYRIRPADISLDVGFRAARTLTAE